jgi:uncharacterized protein (DUF1786 family)
MKILAIDIGTGTQDILLYDTRLQPENGFKLVLPSPTMIVHRRIKRATGAGRAIVITGKQMGGGPSAWAAEAHARAGLRVYATAEAATTLNDDLEAVQALGIRLVSEDEAKAMPEEVERIRFGDLDLGAIRAAFSAFGVQLQDLDAVAAAVFDHGNAPRGISDRQFRFDYLDERIRAYNRLSAFAFRSEEVPEIMTRLRAVAESQRELDCPLVVMDTAPAAVLGAVLDPAVAARPRRMIANIGNFHTLAFRLGEQEIEGVFEHHTGEIDLPKLERLLRSLADGSLRHEDVFNDMGHGALMYTKETLRFGEAPFDVVVTGPRRAMMEGTSLRPHFAAPFGDMMIAGCFGLVAAVGDVMPELGEEIRESMRGGRAVTPWDVEG